MKPKYSFFVESKTLPVYVYARICAVYVSLAVISDYRGSALRVCVMYLPSYSQTFGTEQQKLEPVACGMAYPVTY
jgi:hypothetical protein